PWSPGSWLIRDQVHAATAKVDDQVPERNHEQLEGGKRRHRPEPEKPRLEDEQPQDQAAQAQYRNQDEKDANRALLCDELPSASQCVTTHGPPTEPAPTLPWHSSERERVVKLDLKRSPESRPALPPWLT